MRYELRGGFFKDQSGNRSISMLRVSHANLGQFPSEILLRTSEWGYVWNSPWVVYTSFPMRKGTDTKEVSDAALRKALHSSQWKQAAEYNGDSSTEEDDSMSDEGDF